MSEKFEHECLVSTKIVLKEPQIEACGAKLGTGYWNMGPLLQGVIMGCISQEQADLMHKASFNPYSQYCIAKNNRLVWVVNSLTRSTFNKMTEPILIANNLMVKKLGFSLNFGEISQIQLSYKNLVETIHEGSGNKFTLRFVSPTSFKSKGAYQNIPTLHLIYQNLLMHYCQVFEASHEVDAETINYLAEHTRIAKYNLQSRYFTLAGKKIPAFTGTMDLEISGPPSLVGLARMLFKFGSFSGVGIKTSMGMGGLVVE